MQLGKYDDIEKREAARDGAQLVRNSGRSQKTIQKGDATMDHYLVDYKYTEKSFTLSRGVWSKVSTDAGINGQRTPTLKIIMEGDDDSTLRLWVIDDKEFQDIRDSYRVLSWLDANDPDALERAREFMNE